jgi:very-short-patch-repair endonuclease
MVPIGPEWSWLTTCVVLCGRACDCFGVKARHPVPAALRTRPFTSTEASDAGITRGQLRGASYRRLGSGLYRWVGLNESPQVLLAAVARRLPPGAAFSGRTAAWLHGLDVAPCDPIELTIPEPMGSGRRAGAIVRRTTLSAEQIVLRRGLPVTSALRTVVDLGGRDPLTEGVVAADLFLHADLVNVAELRRYVAEHPGAKGIARLRRVVDLADPKAESAMETRLRMVIVLARLPRPEVQVPIHDDKERFLGRPDLLYRNQRLAIEYDGVNHRDRLADDNRRQNGLVGAGFRLLRFTASDVYGTPDLVAMQVRHGLGLLGRKGRIHGN